MGRKRFSILFLAVMLTLALPICVWAEEKKPPQSSLSPQQVQAALDAINKKFATLPTDTSHRASTNREMLTFIQQRPEVASAAINEDNTGIWIELRNGQFSVIFNDREPLSATNTGAITLKASNVSGSELPEQSQARLLNALGTAYPPVGPTLAPLLTAPGSNYNLATSDSSIEGLKKVAGDGFFYIETHGLLAPRNNKFGGYFALWTSTPVTPANDALYEVELDSNLIIRGVANHDRLSNGDVTKVSHYAVTQKFIQQYMKFGKNSFVFADACQTDNEDLKKAFLSGGASVFAGWTKDVRPSASKVAAVNIVQQSLGDRLNNKSAINYIEVKNKLHSLGFDKDEKTGAELIFTYLQDGYAQLAPSIDSASYDKTKKQITINGTFGSNPGADGVVTLGTTTLPIVPQGWSPTQIICSAAGTASGTYDLSVSVRGHKSNGVSVVIPPMPTATPIPTPTLSPDALPTEFRGSISYHSLQTATSIYGGPLKVEDTITGDNLVFTGSGRYYAITSGDIHFYHIFSVEGTSDGKSYYYSEEGVEKQSKFAHLSCDYPVKGEATLEGDDGHYLDFISTTTEIRDGKKTTSQGSGISSDLGLLHPIILSRSGNTVTITYNLHNDKVDASVNLVGVISTTARNRKTN